MKTRSLGVLGGTLLVLALAACETKREPEEATGRVMLSITSAPADAACLRITVKGASTAVRLLPLMTGMSTVFPLEGLPLGSVEFTGEAFPITCAMVGATSVPTYVSEVVVVTLADGEAVSVALALRRPGRAVVSVDFPDGGPAGQPNGSACTSAGACASGFCSQGVCCNTACTGSCQSCNRMAALGVCGPSPAGVTCSTATCMGATAIPGGTCNALGMCQVPPSQNCAPFSCQNGACRTSCMSSADCQAGFNCQAGSCVSMSSQPNGSMCSAASQCASGFCVDGFCCNTTCTGTCLSCNRAGAVGTCSPDPAGVACSPQNCTGSTFIPPGFCTGTGMCAMPPSRSCAPYVCGMSACLVNCASNADCQPGVMCQNGQCAVPSMPVTIAAEADAYVRDGTPTTNFGADPTLPVKNSSTAGNSRISYLRFPLAAVATVGQARLRLYGSRPTVSMLTDAAFAVPAAMWTEAGITWNNRPAVGNKLGVSVVVSGSPQYHEWDVTAHVQLQKLAGAGSVTVAVQMETGTGNGPDVFNAREAGSNPPQLVVVP